MVCTSYQILFVCCRAVSATEDVAPPLEVSNTLDKGGTLKVKSEPGQCARQVHVLHLT